MVIRVFNTFIFSNPQIVVLTFDIFLNADKYKEDNVKIWPLFNHYLMSSDCIWDIQRQINQVKTLTIFFIPVWYGGPQKIIYEVW